MSILFAFQALASLSIGLAVLTYSVYAARVSPRLLSQFLNYFAYRLSHKIVLLTLVAALCFSACFSLQAATGKSMSAEVGGLFIPASRSELVIVPRDIAEVVVADPTIADVHVIGAKRLVFIGKNHGRTDAKLFDKENHIIRQFDIVVGYDLPGIRKALHFFLPHEKIAVELVNTNIALMGEVSDATIADKAVTIVSQFMGQTGGTGGGQAASASSSSGQGGGGQGSGGGKGGQGGGGQGGGQGGAAASTSSQINPNIINLMKVISGQQVMLRVKVAEIQRNALKQLGMELAAKTGSSHAGILFGSNGGQQSFVTGTSNPFPGLTVESASLAGGGLINGFFDLGRAGLSAALNALETEGLLRTLAEPDLVAMSGEKAEFLAGGQFPIPSVQVGSNGVAPVTTVQFQQFGVSVQFIPFVLSENRIRLIVQPEVSQIDTANQTTITGTTVPGLDTRRAKTTVELAPGESFMIAGLLQDTLNANISQIPGASELPVLGSLFRSTSYQRGETELVIAVTPYIVDPLKNNDVRFPTDEFRPASTMEQFFYGALSSMSGNAYRISQTPSLEGPIGFMTD